VSAWIFLQRFPTPDALAQAGKRQWQKFLHSRPLCVTSTSVTLSTFLLSRASPVVSGPTFTINITAKRKSFRAERILLSKTQGSVRQRSGSGPAAAGLHPGADGSYAFGVFQDVSS
jgi:hypothetical protein